jgi:DNA-binding NarL/FixJ family response regulator
METFEAANGCDALAILSANDIDVFITDIGLLDVSGLELAIQARRSKPDLSVAFFTGDMYVEGANQVPGSVTLPKPCPDDEMAAAIRQLAGDVNFET